MSILNKPYFRDEEAAHSFLESIVWKDGPVCPHCGVVGHTYKIKANPDKRVRYGLHKCGACRKQFTVKIGTVFEHLRIPLHKALQAAYLLCASKKGISSNQLSRTLQIRLKAAWFLSHRVREAMRPGGELAMFGQDGQFVEMDETYIGRKVGRQKMRGVGHKMALCPWSSVAARSAHSISTISTARRFLTFWKRTCPATRICGRTNCRPTSNTATTSPAMRL